MASHETSRVEHDQRNELDHLLGKDTPREPKNKSVRIFGLLLLLAFFGGFTLWSYLAPIDSAAMAPGKLVVTGSRRIIQHLEGGIIKKIYVRDGSEVKKGEILVQLEDTQAKTSLALTRSEAFQLYAIEARLMSERDDTNQLDFDPRLVQASKDDQKLQKVMSSQYAIFKANKKSYEGNVTILKQQSLQLVEQIKGIKGQYVANKKQYDLIKEETKEIAYLAAKKLVEKARLLALQRNAAQLQGVLGDNIAQVAVLKQRIGETKTKIITLGADRLKDTLVQLREVQQQLSNLLKREVVEEDEVNRTSIRSPQNGSVVALQVHTVGGVIQSGESIMDIVPNEKLIIEARITPLDIDVVHKGLEASVQLISFKSRTTPSLIGTVINVSADSFQDQQTGEQYYRAEIELGKDQLARLAPGQDLYPGMPVQVMIVTDKRTLFQYLFSPIGESFNRAFREQ